MKVLKYFIFTLTIIFPTLSQSQIIEFGNGYGVDRHDKSMVRSTWNEKDFKKLSVIYDINYDEPKTGYGGVWSIGDREPYITDDSEIKELLNDGYKAIKVYDKFMVSINLSNETISTIRVYSSETMDDRAEAVRKYIDLKKKFPGKWNEDNQQNLDWITKYSKQEAEINKYKIEEYVGGIFIGRLFKDISYDDGRAIKLDIDTGSYKIGHFNKINQQEFTDWYFKCTKDYKNIKIDTKNNKKSNSGLKELLKKIY